MMVLLTILSLLLGLACGFFELQNPFILMISQNSDLILYLLMLSVGISIGMHKGIVQKIREYHIRIFIIPIGIMISSLLGGVVCSLLFQLPLGHGTAIASGMGWYSLAGSAIGNIAGAQLGSIAFLSNLMREVFSFLLIPFLAAHLNQYACIAPAGATSEDTTLPVILK